MGNPDFRILALLLLLPALSCTGEAEESPATDAPSVQPADTAAVGPADATAFRAIDTLVSETVDTPAARPADTSVAPAPDTRAADTSAVPGPMIHPRREPPTDATDSAAASSGGDPRGSPADTAAWTIGTASAPARVDVPPLPVLAALRTGTHPDYARMTVEIGPDAPGPPGYRAEYIDRPLTECGSGRQIYPVGDAWLELRLEPAAAHTEAGQPTLGEREIAVDGPLLLRVYRTCDFEGIVTLVMALASPNPFRVLTLSDPWRIVVDVQR